MTPAAPRRLGWPTWTIFALGLAAAPIDAFLILFWRWAATHHAVETGREDAYAAVTLCVLAGVCVGAIVAMFRRWRAAALTLSLLLLVPPAWVSLSLLIGST